MEKKGKQNQEGSLTDAYSLFVYAIRTQITRDYYLRRLRTFFDFIELLPNAKIEHRCNHFAAMAIKNRDWTFGKIIGFLQFQKERVEREEITAATLYNFVKALKLFCEMSDVPISWKKITRGLPKVRSFADDKAPTIDEIRKMMEYPDRRMKAIICTMDSSGIRLGAWDHWECVEPIMKDGCQNLLSFGVNFFFNIFKSNNLTFQSLKQISVKFHTVPTQPDIKLVLIEWI